MRIVTDAMKGKAAAAAWKEQYCSKGEWDTTYAGPADVEYRKILKAKGDPRKIEAALGGERSWTHETCAECHKYATRCVEFDNWDRTVCICDACFGKAAKLLRAAKKGTK